MNNQMSVKEITRVVSLRVRLAQDETLTREEWVEANEVDWVEIGAEFREGRLKAGITLAKMARETGFSASTLRRFEVGQPVMRANVIASSYNLILENSDLKDVCQQVFEKLCDVMGPRAAEQFWKDEVSGVVEGGSGTVVA
ncbi:helix-turn-helix domain-containing protein [Paenibacillus sp. NPDC057967]|uniref:helix-turn-helix domain-containing protein n=1 Tax=Paenibacillus sp. NPDC057967 TaxID=3346293 RepID=UPI0036D91E6F